MVAKYGLKTILRVELLSHLLYSQTNNYRYDKKSLYVVFGKKDVSNIKPGFPTV
jgi:hypothetical protein